jgi:hypothetical protein
MPPCIVCGTQAGSTKEDNPALWVAEWISRNHKTTLPGFRLQRQGGELGPLRDRFNVKVPCCERCNRWLNVNVELPAIEVLKQVLAGLPSLTELSEEDQTHIATWVYKVLMCTVGLPLSQDEKNAFRATSRPPTTETIWIGKMAPPSQLNPTRVFHQPERSFPELRISRSRTMPFHLYRLFAFVFTTPWLHGPRLVLPAELAQYLVRIWPPTGDAVPWPPELMIDGATHKALLKAMM